MAKKLPVLDPINDLHAAASVCVSRDVRADLGRLLSLEIDASSELCSATGYQGTCSFVETREELGNGALDEA